ncbi:Polypeptide N-acetylgalactosaminyltransferase 3 [Bienertia sinuspersici]
MASLFNFSVFVNLALLSTILVQGTLGGGLTCEQLNKEDCAFAVSNTGKRCVLEKYVRRSGKEAYKCTTSAIEAYKLKDLVETNHCIEACGLDRDTIGISSDSLLESRFTQKLCSPQCYRRCPNIVDLYFNLAAGEGVFLPKLCATQSKNPRRGMSEIQSSGMATPGPISGIDASNLMGAPMGSPISSLELDSGNPVDMGAPSPAMSPYY